MRNLGRGNRLYCEASFYALYSDSPSGTEEVKLATYPKYRGCHLGEVSPVKAHTSEYHSLILLLKQIWLSLFMDFLFLLFLHFLYIFFLILPADISFFKKIIGI